MWVWIVAVLIILALAGYALLAYQANQDAIEAYRLQELERQKVAAKKNGPMYVMFGVVGYTDKTAINHGPFYGVTDEIKIYPPDPRVTLADLRNSLTGYGRWNVTTMQHTFNPLKNMPYPMRYKVFWNDEEVAAGTLAVDKSLKVNRENGEVTVI